jgi:excisionase family DNA binding protein
MEYNLSIKDLCRQYGRNKTTIYDWMKRGLYSKKIGGGRRFSQQDIDRWIEGQNQKGEKENEQRNY